MASKKREEKDVESFQAVAQAIERVGGGSKDLVQIAGYRASPSDGWLIKRSFLTFDFIPTSSVCWVYGKDVKHSINFIPTYTEYAIVVKIRSGKTLTESHRRRIARGEKLDLLRRVAPWAVFGYSEQAEKAWRTSRDSFAAEVDSRHNLLIR